ncbi:MAG TPA: protease pro-enzyme activation domain-containing protein [Bryobacteraceae bacterium]|nr:protease pro-enzyme activation domain-containing protein [Bryobacteraceae bacterium]
MSSLRARSLALVIAAFAGGCLFAQPGDRTKVSNNTPGFIAKGTDLGPIDPTAILTVNVWLKLHNQQQLDKLVEEQTRKGSAGYHRWITQDQFNADYGPAQQEVNAVSNFLSAHDLAVVSVAENNLYVKAQGTAAAIEQAFNTQIHQYSLNGALYRSNTADPSINGPAGGLIAAITGLDDYGFEPQIAVAHSPEGVAVTPTPLGVSPQGVFFEAQCFRAPEVDFFAAGATTATYTGNRYGSDITSGPPDLPPCGYAPAELQTAYNLNPLYAAGLDGTGETIVITDAYGSPTIEQDAAAFAAVYGLPPINLQIAKAPGLSHNPGDTKRNWDVETTLDVEWAHAIAPGAAIVLVVATDRASLDEAINYAVVHHLGNTISNSWSSVEGLGNPAQFDRVNRVLEMAAAQGIDVNFATGDFGDEVARVGFQSVDFPASSPFATAVGGTSLALNPDDTIAFQTGWGNNLTRIADTKALGNPPVNPPLHLGFQGGAGGGPSLTFARPSFQSGLSVPGNTRLVPDVAMVADAFTGVEIIQTVGGQLTVSVIGGTSLSTPMFSGIMAIAAQKAGHGLGQAAALVYSLPAGAVTDILAVSSPNDVIGTINATPYTASQLAASLGNTTSFYSAIYNSPFSTRWFVISFGTDSSLVTGPGWDNVTGVGTPNGIAFVDAIAP